MNFSIIPIGSVLLSFVLPCPISVADSRCVAVPHHVTAIPSGAAIGPSAPQLARLRSDDWVLTQTLASAYIRAQSAPPLPSANSPKLRTALLARATAHLSPKWKNPGISGRGLDPAVITALQEQQAYLRVAHRGTPLPAADVPCPDPLIRSVDGKTMGAIFTPQMPSNSYRIEGCLFGNIRGRIDLEPHPSDPALKIPPIPLTVDTGRSSWSNTQIEAHLDSHLSGIPDVPVTLVIHRPEGQRLELSGCFFVAARSEPKLLESIPASWIGLQPNTIHSRPIQRLEYVSPPVKGSDVPADAAGASAFVSRLDAESFGAGADVYDFSQLNPGWVVDSVQLQTYAVACPGASLIRQSLGHWDTQWNGRKLTVQLQDDVCVSRVSPSFAFNLSVSQYALKVWVVGPVGTKPLADALLHDENRSLTN